MEYDFSDLITHYCKVLVRNEKHYKQMSRDISDQTYDESGLQWKHLSHYIYVEVLQGDEMPKKVKEQIKVNHCDECREIMINEKGICEKCQEDLNESTDDYPEDSWR
jgi:hypothetical protein